MDAEHWIEKLRKYKEDQGLSSTSLAKQLGVPFQIFYKTLSGETPPTFKLKLHLTDRSSFSSTRDMLLSVMPTSTAEKVRARLIAINHDHVRAQLTAIPSIFFEKVNSEGMNSGWRVLLDLAISKAGSAAKLSRIINVTPQTIHRMMNYDRSFGQPLKLDLIEYLNLEINDKLLYLILSENHTNDFNSIHPDVVRDISI